MVTPKANHYISQLNAALSAGEWTTRTPAKNPNGKDLSWSELFRKFRKHCPQQHEAATIAELTQKVSSLLLKGKGTADLDGDALDPKRPLSAGSLCSLASDKFQEAQTAFNQLLKDEKPSERVKSLKAYYAFALNDLTSCQQHLLEPPTKETVASRLLKKSPNLSAGSPPSNASAASLVTRVSRSLGTSPSVVSLHPQVTSGNVCEITERIRSLYLKGLCYENSDSPNVKAALGAYRSVMPVITHLQSIVLEQGTQASNAANTFTSMRECWRWCQRSLFRAISLSAQHEPLSETLILLRFHRNISNFSDSKWPPSFRPLHRSIIYIMHFRALIVHPSTSDEIRTLTEEYKKLLSHTTSFPKAGDRNDKVEDFVDLVVASWDRCTGGGRGEGVEWVIETLWWATSYTFNSPRIYRYLSRLLFAQASAAPHSEALQSFQGASKYNRTQVLFDMSRRALAVYVEVVSKARASGDTVNPESWDVWVTSLVHGARRLGVLATRKVSRTRGEEDLGMRDVETAKQYIAHARSAMPSEGVMETEDLQKIRVLSASIDLADGILEALSAVIGENPETRHHHCESSIKLLERSHSLHSTSEAAYYLAIALARPSSNHRMPTASSAIERAISVADHGPSIRRALQYAEEASDAEPHNVKYAHLKALLTMKIGRGDMAKALDIIKASIQIANTQLRDVLHVGNSISRGQIFGSVGFNEEKQSTSDGGPQLQTLLFSGATTLPSIASLICPSPSDCTPCSAREIFEDVLSLKLTEIALNEYTEGPEGANAKWLDLLSWFTDNKGYALGEDVSIGRNVRSDVGTDEVSGRKSGESIANEREDVESLPPAPDEAENSRESERASLTNYSRPSPLPLSNRSNVPTLKREGSHPTQAGSRNSTFMSIATVIKITPATPMEEDAMKVDGLPQSSNPSSQDRARSDDSASETGGPRPFPGGHASGVGVKHGKNSSHPFVRRRNSKDSDGQRKRIERMQQMQQAFRSQVHKGTEGIKTVSRKIGKGGGALHLGKKGQQSKPQLQRSNSAPDFHAVLARSHPYQASSIHSRPRTSSWALHRSTAHEEMGGHVPSSPPASPTPQATLPTPPPSTIPVNDRTKWEREWLCELWLRAAASYRRGDRVDDCRNALQEAELLNKENVNLWVQYGLYLSATSDRLGAKESFNKALFLDPDSVPAAVHFANLVITSSKPSTDEVDLVIGLLTNATLYRGWDVPEVWLVLAKACRLQGRVEKERELLSVALSLSQTRGLRTIDEAIGICF